MNTTNVINNLSLSQWQEDDYTKLVQLFKRDAGIPHSILLYGMHGLGISQLALFWIKYIFCESPSGNYSCNLCQSCVLMSDNSHPDLYNLSADLDLDIKNKTINVEAIRDVIDFLALSPHLGGYKIVFIPDANLLTLSSANALLKILEEPPCYALFVIASTNIGQLLPTIKSRCYKQIILRPKLLDTMKHNNTSVDPTNIDKFWQAYYDNCPLFETPLVYDELQLFVSTLTTPSIDNIFALTQVVDGKVIKFGFVLDFLQKWLSDAILYKMTNQLNYFLYFETHIIKIMPNLQINKVFYLSDRLSFLTKWENHPLNYKLLIENLMFQYQQLFIE